MILIVFLYGLSFFVLGIVMGLLAISSAPPLSRRILGNLAIFGLLHGVADWSRIFFLLEQQGLRIHLPNYLILVLNIVLGVSFLFLLVFGIDLLESQHRWTRLRKALFFSSFFVWAVLIVFIAPQGGIDAVLRYTVGIFSCFLAAFALWPSRILEETDHVYGRYKSLLKLSSLTMLLYAISSGVIRVDLTDWTAGTVFWTVHSRSLVGVVIGVRAVSAVLLTGLLTLTYFRELIRIQWIQSSQKLRDEFGLTVIHDLRGSLSTIQMASELLMKGVFSGDEARIQKLARLVRSGAVTMKRLLSDLALSTSADLDRISLKIERFDLVALIRGLVSDFEATIESHPLEVKTPPKPVLIEGDPGRLEQVLTNLVSNAVKYSYPSSTIRLEMKEDPSSVVVSVTNQGIGLAEDEVPRLFSRYYRARSAEHTPGTGLGLYSVKEIIAAHRGEVSVSSTPMKSTTFSFRIPLAEKANGLGSGEARRA